MCAMSKLSVYVEQNEQTLSAGFLYCFPYFFVISKFKVIFEPPMLHNILTSSFLFNECGLDKTSYWSFRWTFLDLFYEIIKNSSSDAAVTIYIAITYGTNTWCKKFPRCNQPSSSPSFTNHLFQLKPVTTCSIYPSYYQALTCCNEEKAPTGNAKVIVDFKNIHSSLQYKQQILRYSVTHELWKLEEYLQTIEMLP